MLLMMLLRKLINKTSHRKIKRKDIFGLKSFWFPLIKVTLYSWESGEYEEFKIGPSQSED